MDGWMDGLLLDERVATVDNRLQCVVYFTAIPHSKDAYSKS